MPDIIHECPAYDSWEADVIWINLVVDSCYFQRNNMVQELEQLHMEYLKLHDILCCSPWYNQFKAEVFKKEFNQSFEQDVEQPRDEVLKKSLVLVIQIRFPELESVARNYVQNIQDPALLSDMLKQAWRVTDQAQAMMLLQT